MDFTKNKLLRKLFYEGVWSIGIYNAKKPTDIYENINIKNPVLEPKDITDTNARFIADPFIIKYNDTWYMFFEIYSDKKDKGVIGVATSKDCCIWEYKNIVLEESFHLSYPYVFEYNNKMYMIPESGDANYIGVYEATDFPYGWKLNKKIIDGCYRDSSIFRYNDMWWILTHNDKKDEESLCLFYSEDLCGDWKPHKKSPVVTNNVKLSRPAGRVIVDDGKIYRYSQEGINYYGELVRCIEITKLTIDDYEEKELKIIAKGSGEKGKWNKDGVHNIDMYRDENQHWVVLDGQCIKKCKMRTKFKYLNNKIKSAIDA